MPTLVSISDPAGAGGSCAASAGTAALGPAGEPPRPLSRHGRRWRDGEDLGVLGLGLGTATCGE